jgi:hypothetical protein
MKKYAVEGLAEDGSPIPEPSTLALEIEVPFEV